MSRKREPYVPLEPDPAMPLYIYANDVAQLAGWKERDVVKIWKFHGIAMVRRHRWVTTPYALAGIFPEQLEAILAALAARKSNT